MSSCLAYARRMPKALTRRTEQLRRAKRAQRERDATNGLVPCQVKLPAATARRLREALVVPGMAEALDAFLADEVIDAARFPNLRLLLWNRSGNRVSARDAFSLYENNWRLVDMASMPDHERALVRKLADRFGRGLLNV